ncbi:hypothetical protein PGT21_000051 [Puccinia graminis f. sp. tritici]|uniref:Uncharacterized protein n=1 Tax=Puccinia graminis f. sp. tritici TaxID=56615 RepID=A0A5B0NIX3_PUCGR|nr:hypothetical protein PGT21_000051 [Puccinia graminis f. sp. tritici]
MPCKGDWEERVWIWARHPTPPPTPNHPQLKEPQSIGPSTSSQLNNHPSRYRLDSQLKQPNTPTPPPIPLNTATRTPQTTRPTEDRIALNTRLG